MLRVLMAGAILSALVACGGGPPPGTASQASPTPPAGAPSSATAGASGLPTPAGSTVAGDFKICSPGWAQNSQNCSIHVGDKLMVSCPPGGTLRSIWGTDTYTADSSVCTAAVHAGLIGVDAGGDVYLEVTAGIEEYVGSERNGVKSGTRGEWLTSFQFIAAPAP
jgi:hypothetical protein